MNDRKRNITIILAIILMLTLTIGGTYAAFTFFGGGEKVNTITTSTLSMSFTESDNVIELEGALPTTDQTGKTLDDYFNFTVEKTGSVQDIINYEIAVKKIDGNTIKGEYIKFYLTEVTDSGEFALMEPAAYNELTEINEETGMPSEMMSLVSGTYESGTIKKDYRLRMWVSEDYNPQGDGGNLTFSAKINVYGNQLLETKPNAPVLAENMIPVIYNEEVKAWQKADETTEWYNYDKQNWANAVTVTEASRSNYQSASAGTNVSMDDILQMFVWIPRYSYTIKSEDGINYYGKQEEGRIDIPSQALPGEIDVKFIGVNEKENGSAKYTGSTPSNWFTPPGFTFGGIEQAGLWVGKFEPSPSASCTNANTCNVNNLDVYIKPNVSSWRYINISNIDTVSRNVVRTNNPFGYDSTYDSHAAKNTEWATISYLTQSKYGKYGNSLYTGANKEIYINNYHETIGIDLVLQTGCSGGTPTADDITTCQYKYDDLVDAGNGVGYRGAGSSTTGNITGIYDISGGASEYVMANLNKTAANSEITVWPDEKYYDLYKSGNCASTACNELPCKGHSLNEVAGWYSDSTVEITTSFPWVHRSGGFNNDRGAGPLAFSYNNGNIHSSISFRLILTPQ